jgi:hypothetical protein
MGSLEVGGDKVSRTHLEARRSSPPWGKLPEGSIPGVPSFPSQT